MINKNLQLNCLLLCLLPGLAGCLSVPAFETRVRNAEDIARNSGWQPVSLTTPTFQLRAFLPKDIKATTTLNVYIEGDGLAWRSRHRISNNPTPVKPLALQLALRDPNPAAYLARPCQYVQIDKGCNISLWTSARFSAETITASNSAVDLLKEKFSAKSIRLIGYSGGGGVAALVAARRNDVIQLVTVAGNLDHAAWTKHHNVSPLSLSLNPADAWQDLQYIPQVHFVGTDDSNIGAFVAESFRRRFPLKHRPQVRIIDGADHGCCWVNKWPGLLQLISTIE